MSKAVRQDRVVGWMFEGVMRSEPWLVEAAICLSLTDEVDCVDLENFGESEAWRDSRNARSSASAASSRLRGGVVSEGTA